MARASCGLHHLIPFHMENRDYIISCIQQVDENVISASLASLAAPELP